MTNSLNGFNRLGTAKTKIRGLENIQYNYPSLRIKNFFKLKE